MAAAVRRARINIARSTTPPLRANTLAAHAETAAKERPATPRCARGKVPRAGVDITSRRQPADVASANSNVASCVPCAKHVLTSVNRAILRSPAPLTATPPVDEAASTRANNLGIQTFNQSKRRRKRQRCGRATYERPTGRNCIASRKFPTKLARLLHRKTAGLSTGLSVSSS